MFLMIARSSAKPRNNAHDFYDVRHKHRKTFDEIWSFRNCSFAREYAHEQNNLHTRGDFLAIARATATSSQV
jgi:hypothetical protein